jgi:hypothetical protein
MKKEESIKKWRGTNPSTTESEQSTVFGTVPGTLQIAVFLGARILSTVFPDFSRTTSIQSMKNDPDLFWDLKEYFL